MKLITLTPVDFARLPRWQKRPIHALLLGRFVIAWSAPVTPTENGDTNAGR